MHIVSLLVLNLILSESKGYRDKAIVFTRNLEGGEYSSINSKLSSAVKSSKQFFDPNGGLSKKINEEFAEKQQYFQSLKNQASKKRIMMKRKLKSSIKSLIGSSIMSLIFLIIILYALIYTCNNLFLSRAHFIALLGQSIDCRDQRSIVNSLVPGFLIDRQGNWHTYEPEQKELTDFVQIISDLI